jgi:hypothetical protein
MKMNIVIVLLLLVGCSKVEFSKEGCTPLLRYQLPNDTSFVISEITKEGVHHRIVKEGLKPYIAFREEHDKGSNNTHDIEIHVKSNYIQLLGPILSYKKSPFSSFDTSSIYYYAQINNHKVWLSQAGLKIISRNFSSEINQKLEQKSLENRLSSGENNKTFYCQIDTF